MAAKSDHDGAKPAVLSPNIKLSETSASETSLPSVIKGKSSPSQPTSMPTPPKTSVSLPHTATPVAQPDYDALYSQPPKQPSAAFFPRDSAFVSNFRNFRRNASSASEVSRMMLSDASRRVQQLEEQAMQLHQRQSQEQNGGLPVILRGEKMKVEGGEAGGGAVRGGGGGGLGVEDDLLSWAETASRLRAPPFFEIRAISVGGGAARPKSRGSKLEQNATGAGVAKDTLNCLGLKSMAGCEGLELAVESVVQGKRFNMPMVVAAEASGAANKTLSFGAAAPAAVEMPVAAEANECVKPNIASLTISLHQQHRAAHGWQ
jgi:hypothetical protein